LAGRKEDVRSAKERGGGGSYQDLENPPSLPREEKKRLDSKNLLGGEGTKKRNTQGCAELAGGNSI